jgi:hypothetical protein
MTSICGIIGRRGSKGEADASFVENRKHRALLPKIGNAVIASVAKQSSTVLRLLDCRVATLLAMTAPID